MYCNNECLTKDWESGHKHECSLLVNTQDKAQLLNKKQILFGFTSDCKCTLPCLAMALMSRVIGFSQMKKAVTENELLGASFNDPRTKGFDKEGKFSFSLEALLSLPDKFDKLYDEEKTSLIKYSVATVMQNPEWADNAEAIAALFIKLYLICVFNYKPITLLANLSTADLLHHKMDLNDAQTVPHYTGSEYGFAVYLASSLIGRSCDPNLARSWYGSTVVYTACEPIKKGEKITETPSYLHRFAESLEKRQALLKERFRVDCKCVACVEKWPTMTEMEEDFDLESDELSNNAVNKILAQPEFRQMYFNGEFAKMLTLVSNLMPIGQKLLPRLEDFLTCFYQEPFKENSRMYANMKLSLDHHYMALGGAIFSKAGRELFTNQKDSHFPMYLDLDNAVEDFKVFRDKYFAKDDSIPSLH
jgi:hypothetical protein